MQARIKSPVGIIPEALHPLLDVSTAAKSGGVDAETLELVHLRVSQINGCSACLYMGAQSAKKANMSEDKTATVAAWREAPFFTDAERAALALAEAATRLADRPDPVPDAIWEEAARHYDERQLAGLVLAIGLTNFWNRVNATTRQVPGGGW